MEFSYATLMELCYCSSLHKWNSFMLYAFWSNWIMLHYQDPITVLTEVLDYVDVGFSFSLYPVY